MESIKIGIEIGKCQVNKCCGEKYRNNLLFLYLDAKEILWYRHHLHHPSWQQLAKLLAPTLSACCIGIHNPARRIGSQCNGGDYSYDTCQCAANAQFTTTFCRDGCVYSFGDNYSVARDISVVATEDSLDMLATTPSSSSSSSSSLTTQEEYLLIGLIH